MDLDLLPAQCAKADQETGVRLTTAAGHHHRPEIDTLVVRLVQEFLRGFHIPQRAQRRVVRRQMDDIRTFSLDRQLLGEAVQGSISSRLVLTLWIRVDLGTEQTIEQDIAGTVVVGRHPLHTILELDHTTKAELGCGGCCSPDVVRLYRPR